MIIRAEDAMPEHAPTSEWQIQRLKKGTRPEGLMVRAAEEMYPDFTPEMERIESEGISTALVADILKKHKPNAEYNQKLYDRYRGLDVPIWNRRSRFQDPKALNNRINNDFFGEIVDFKAGYFAGKPIGYSYSRTEESMEGTDVGGAVGAEAARGRQAVEAAAKALTDFVVLNNMYDVDMECTKLAACCGYAARLFSMEEGEARVRALLPHQAVVLGRMGITEPAAAIWYYRTRAKGDTGTTCTLWRVHYYDKTTVHTYSGRGLGSLREDEAAYPHGFDCCPLQGIPNNAELTGDCDKVLTLIDAYDRALFDANNENESFANAYMLFENVNISDKDIAAGQQAGAFRFFNGGATPGKISFLTKEINDTFLENHMGRLERNIYRFSRTPDLSDENFSQNASGVALKFKLTGLETKCGMFQAKMQSAGVYMFRLLADVWGRGNLEIDPLQCMMEFHRNFPLDLAGEAQAVGALVSAGLPEEVAFGQLSFIEDVDYVMQLKEERAIREAPVASNRPPFGVDDDAEEDESEDGDGELDE